MKIKYFLFAFLSLSFIIIDKFILTKTFGWLEFIPFIISVMLLIFSIIKLYQLFNLPKIFKIILMSISVALILWFSMMGIDYKRHKNLYTPLFNIGYEVKEDYDMNIQSGHIYKNKSTFYLFGIKLDEVYIVED